MTLAANLAGGLVMAAMIVIALPEVRVTAAELGRHYATLGISWRSLMFTGLLGGHAAYTWAGWALALAWSGLGNLIGGVVLVTSIRLLQVPHRIAEERTGR